MSIVRSSASIDLETLGSLRNGRSLIGAQTSPIRDLVYELAGSQNRDLAVDVLIYATGVAEFDLTSLRDYARKHGLTPEGFRQHVLKLQRRLGLQRKTGETAPVTLAVYRHAVEEFRDFLGDKASARPPSAQS